MQTADSKAEVDERPVDDRVARSTSRGVPVAPLTTVTASRGLVRLSRLHWRQPLTHSAPLMAGLAGGRTLPEPTLPRGGSSRNGGRHDVTSICLCRSICLDKAQAFRDTVRFEKQESPFCIAHIARKHGSRSRSCHGPFAAQPTSRRRQWCPARLGRIDGSDAIRSRKTLCVTGPWTQPSTQASDSSSGCPRAS